MAAAAEADHRHASGNRSFDSRNTVLHHNAVFRRRAETLRGEQEQIGRGLAVRDLRGAEHMRVEKRQQAGHREALADPVEMAVRGDAARRRQRGEQLLDPGHRRQLALEGGSRADAQMSRRTRPGSARPNRVSTAAERVARFLPKPSVMASSIVVGKSTADQALGENAGEDQLAVDQHTVAIEDDELGQR